MSAMRTNTHTHRHTHRHTFAHAHRHTRTRTQSRARARTHTRNTHTCAQYGPDSSCQSQRDTHKHTHNYAHLHKHTHAQLDEFNSAQKIYGSRSGRAAYACLYVKYITAPCNCQAGKSQIEQTLRMTPPGDLVLSVCLCACVCVCVCGVPVYMREGVHVACTHVRLP